MKKTKLVIQQAENGTYFTQVSKGVRPGRQAKPQNVYRQHRGRSVFQSDKVAQGHRRRGTKSLHCERSYAAVY